MRRSVVALATVVLALAVEMRAARADDGDRKRRAKVLWREGTARYNIERFDEAITLFEQAYEVFPFPNVLFNLAQAHRQAKRYEKALFYFHAYLREAPDVEDLIRELDPLVAAQKSSDEKPPEGVQPPPGERPRELATGEPGPRLARAAAVPAPAPTGTSPIPDSHREAWYADRWGWAIAGGGLAVTGLGVGFLVNAASLADQADKEIDQDRRANLREDSRTWRTVGLVLAAAGGGGLVLAVVKLAWPSAPGRGARSTGVVLGPTWVGLQGSF